MDKNEMLLSSLNDFQMIESKQKYLKQSVPKEEINFDKMDREYEKNKELTFL